MNSGPNNFTSTPRFSRSVLTFDASNMVHGTQTEGTSDSLVIDSYPT